MLGIITGLLFGSVTIEPGAGWTPLAGNAMVREGSALDFTELAGKREPAGAHGWTVAKNGHFEFEGKPGERQRFYGVNLCFSGNFMDEAEAEELCTRLARIGYNAIRIHHYESMLCEGSADGTAINPKRMAELDNLMASAIRHGLYVTTDLYVSRAVPFRVCGFDRDGTIPAYDFKLMALAHESVFSNLVVFAKGLLGHVNPRTGRRWADEPALPLVSLINEGNPFCMGLSFARGMFGISTNRMDDVAFTSHVLASHRRFNRRMIGVLRDEIGYRGLVSGLNGWKDAPEYRGLREDYDYIDDHFYVDHPRFLGSGWCLPSRCENRNPLTYANRGIDWNESARLADRPFTISEWNFSAPGSFRGVAGLIFGAGAALQDMDGVWRFAWSHSHDRLLKDGAIGYFDAAVDPLMQASERAMIALYLRGDMPVDRNVIAPRNGGRLLADTTNGMFTVSTPLTCGVFAEASSARHDAGAMSVTIAGHAAAVWATSLDGQPVRKSRHILVSHVTDVQDAGTVFRAEDRKVLEKWGNLPHLMANGTAELAFSQGVFRPTTVYALNADGSRRGKVKITRLPSAFRFTADVARDPKVATYLYEIVCK